MDTAQLETFLAVARTGSMNRAAEELFLSQPGVRKRLDALEAELGIPLFVRDAHGCVVTEAGAVLQCEAAGLIDRLDAIRTAMDTTKGTGHIDLCVLPDIADPMSDKMVIAFRRLYPDIRVHRVALSTSRWLDAVAQGEADVCSTFFVEGRDPQLPAGTALHPCATPVRLTCIMAPDHDLANRSSLTLDDLAGHKVLAGTLMYHQGGWDHTAREHGVVTEARECAGSRFELMDMCEEGAIFVHPFAFGESLRPMASIPLDDLTVRTALVCREEPTAAVRLFLEFARNQTAHNPAPS